MIYDIYHDESQEEAFWHIFLFIPRKSREEVLKYLKRAKQLSNFKGKHLSSKDLYSDTSFECAKSWLSIFLATLQQKQKERLEHFYLGKEEYNQSQKRRPPIYKQFYKPPKCKVAIFHLRNKHRDMISYDDLSKIETTFRMGLQGAAHYLFNGNDPLIIGNIFLDREEHYRIIHKRNFDKEKVLNKLNARFREYCSLHSDCEILGENLSDDDHILLDLADIFLGTFRFGFLNPTSANCSDREKRKFNLCKSVSLLIGKLKEGYARMENSRFENFGTFSSAWIDDGDWVFENIAQKFLTGPSVENFKLLLQ